jgi:plastocyanin
MRRALFAGLIVVAALGLTVTTSHGQAPAAWTTVKGAVVLKAGVAAPAMVELKVDKDQQQCLAKGPIKSEEWVVSKAGGVKNVFVWITTLDKKAPPINPKLQEVTKKEVEVDQPCCAFIPHAIALRQGQTLVVKNSSSIGHNVNWSGGKAQANGNVIVPAGKQHVIDNFIADRFPVTISCNVHSWMKGWVRVYDHPYFALTDDEGKFTIPDAPVGKYLIFVWHEGAGWMGGADGRNGKEIEIKADGIDLGKLEL